MQEHGYGPLIWPRCACDHCVAKRKMLFEGAAKREANEDVDLSTKTLADKVFFNPSSGPLERKLAETILYFIPKKKRTPIPPGTRQKMVKRNCECCGKPITVRANRVVRGWGRFCSLDCRAKELIVKPANMRARA